MQARKYDLRGPVTAHLCPKLYSWSVAGPDRVIDQHGFKEYQGFPPSAFSPVLETCVHRLHATILPLASAIPASGGEAANEEP